ncbi:hypothetical protein HY087_01425 [Candidatus Gottesmanbacteria bacterium]|nr:hypothetical protein [Candidatus Gottesmanbacteria bacterium]
MGETATEIFTPSPPIPKENPVRNMPNRKQHALIELTQRAQERQDKPILSHAEQASYASPAPEQATSGSALNDRQTEQIAPAATVHSPETVTKRAWWKNVISKPIPMPRFIVEAIIDNYHKAFPYVFDDNPVRPNITYEHSLYYPPFAVLDVKVPDDSFSKKYPLFNEFITQEVSELAADKRTFFGPLLGLSARVVGATSYRLMYARSFARWKNVQRSLDRVYGKNERKRLVHRAYFLEGDEIKNLEEKAREAGCPLDEAYRPIRETKGSIADDSFWKKIPGKWKDVVARLATAAAANIGKVKLHGLTPVASLDAPHSGGASGTHPKQWGGAPLR